MDLTEIFKNEVKEVPTNEELSEVQLLAEKQLELEREVISISEMLDKAKEELKHVQESLLPEAISRLGLSEFKLKNGLKVTIKDDIFASIRADFYDSAISWLDEVGLGDIVKDEVKVNFGRGDYESSKALMTICKEQGFNAIEKMSVHPQTLKATIREQMAKGVEFPDKFFSVGPIRKAVIKIK